MPLVTPELNEPTRAIRCNLLSQFAQAATATVQFGDEQRDIVVAAGWTFATGPSGSCTRGEKARSCR